MTYQWQPELLQINSIAALKQLRQSACRRVEASRLLHFLSVSNASAGMNMWVAHAAWLVAHCSAAPPGPPACAHNDVRAHDGPLQSNKIQSSLQA